MANHKWRNIERGLYQDENTCLYYQRIRRSKEKGGDTWQCLFTNKVTEARDRLEKRRLVKHAAALGLKVKVRKDEPTVNTILDGFVKAGLPNTSGHVRLLPRYVELAIPYLRTKIGTSLGSQLTQKSFDDYHMWRCKQCKKGDGHRTTDLDLMALSAAFTWAVRAELVDDNPVEGFQRYTDPRKVRHAKDVSFKSMDEVHAYAGDLMKNPRGESAAWQVLFATQTGQRPNELLKMRIDADPGEPGSIVEDQLFVHRSKNPKIVNPSSYIHEGLEETITHHREWLNKRYPNSPWYFPGRGGANALCATALNGIMNKTWAKALRSNKQAQLRTPQGCRATYVTIRRSHHEPDSRIRWEINHTTGGTLESVYGGVPSTWQDGKGKPLQWLPATTKPAWESIVDPKSKKKKAKLQMDN